MELKLWAGMEQWWWFGDSVRRWKKERERGRVKRLTPFLFKKVWAGLCVGPKKRVGWSLYWIGFGFVFILRVRFVFLSL